MVIVLDAHEAVTPAGKFVAVPIPVAPLVVCVILVRAVFIHNVGVLDAADADVFDGEIASKIDVLEIALLKFAEPVALVAIALNESVAAARPKYL